MKSNEINNDVYHNNVNEADDDIAVLKTIT